VSINIGDTISDLSLIRSDQIPFAMKNALNTTGLQFQALQRAHDASIFTERRPDWLDRSIKITHFASKFEPWVTIGVHPPGGDTRADIITKVEDQTQKTPFTGRAVAVPTILITPNKSD